VTDNGVGGAAAFLPCDISGGFDGVFAALLPQPAEALSDPVLIVQNLPVGQCRRIRNGAAEAEVCPAGWEANHLLTSWRSAPVTKCPKADSGTHTTAGSACRVCPGIIFVLRK
jgi:hypothetical protein